MSKQGDRRSRIPVGTHFSPGVISLADFLVAVVKHSGNKELLQEAVWDPKVRIRPPNQDPTPRRRNLPLEAAVQYGFLAADTYEATGLARELAQLQPPELYDRFARHILLRCGGLRVVEAFVEGLCVLEPRGWTAATALRDWAEGCRGVKFGRASLPNEVLKALQGAGLIQYRTGGTGSGKTATLRTTQRFDREVLGPFVRHAIRDLDAVLSAYYRKRPADIFAELDSPDKNVKGKALEAFAIFFMRRLGLRFVGWRKRAQAEVDALLEGVLGPVATRWQVQCKNTPTSKIPLEDVAKEVGILPITGATHLLFVANSRFSDDAVSYARSVMRQTGVGIYLLDKDDFEALRDDPAGIARILRDQAEGMLHAGRPPFYES